MNYRTATKEDIPAINEMCANNGIAPPSEASTVVFVADDGEIRGVAAVKITVQIEPLIGQTPFIGLALAERCMGFITAVSKGPAVAIVRESNEAWISVLEKYGFTITDKHMIVLKKEL